FLARQREMQRSRSKLLDNGAVLLVETHLQSLLAAGIQRKQIEIVIRPAVQDASVEVNGGINERVRGAAIFGLYVIGRATRFHVRIVTEKHFAARPDPAKSRKRFARIFPPHLTEWRSNRYYNSSPMSGSGLHCHPVGRLFISLEKGRAGLA